MFNEQLQQYKRIPEMLIQEYLNTGWIFKFKTAWNKGIKVNK